MKIGKSLGLSIIFVALSCISTLHAAVGPSIKPNVYWTYSTLWHPKFMGVNARGIQEIYTCTFCDDDFATEKEVKYHVYTNHVSLNQCRYCQDYFDSRINLIRHLSIIHAELAHRCIYCSAVFKLHDELATHIQTNHR